MKKKNFCLNDEGMIVFLVVAFLNWYSVRRVFAFKIALQVIINTLKTNALFGVVYW